MTSIYSRPQTQTQRRAGELLALPPSRVRLSAQISSREVEERRRPTLSEVSALAWLREGASRALLEGDGNQARLLTTRTVPAAHMHMRRPRGVYSIARPDPLCMRGVQVRRATRRRASSSLGLAPTASSGSKPGAGADSYA